MRLRLLIAAALMLAAVLAIQMFGRRATAEPLAYATCPWRGTARVVLTPGLARDDTLPVRMHEEVHAAQCQELGPFRYRLRNLTGRGKLSLETPAYCAGARARLTQGIAPKIVRERLWDDAQAAFVGVADSAAVRAALHAACPDIAH